MRTKKARLVAVHNKRLLCNGCYGRLEASAPQEEQRSRQDEQAPAPHEEELAQVAVEELDSGLPYSVVNTGLTVE
ncbi:hypothetical protein [Streptomyces tendae]|uniref:hypothetical protein n=1 Tax=Streptomyces tendae TaxID=1932 RepID=UPI00371D04A0